MIHATIPNDISIDNTNLDFSFAFISYAGTSFLIEFC